MANEKDRDLFKKFIQEMNDIFKSDDFAKSIEGKNQKNLLDDLFALERQFRATLQETPEGRNMYSEFMDFILNEKRNILSTRIYFRERQSAFSTKIAPAFHKKKFQMLFRFRINYNFAKWIVERYTGPRYKRLRFLYGKIIDLRKTLCEQNLPLAINRAKIFWSKSPSFHIEYMDLVQSSAEGLMSAIDKFVPPYRTVFRSVAISRMTLNMTEENSSITVKLSPREKRILYRVNKAKLNDKLNSSGEVLDYVKVSFGNVTQDVLSMIVSAASQAPNLEDVSSNVGELDDQEGIENVVSNQELMEKIRIALDSLSVFDRKILCLKYGIVDE